MHPTARRLLTDRPIAYHPVLAKSLGGVTNGVFVSQLLYWSDKGAEADDWIWKTQADWQDETGLTRREQETARKYLKHAGVLEEQLRGLPAQMYYRINWEGLEKALGVQPSMAFSAKQGWRFPPNKDGVFRQTIYEAETTTETTTETTREGGFVETPKPATPDVPEAFLAISKLPGYTQRNHEKAFQNISAACAEAGVGTQEVVESFAVYYKVHRHRLGWRDPVRVLAKTVHLEIGKALRHEGGNTNAEPEGHTTRHITQAKRLEAVEHDLATRAERGLPLHGPPRAGWSPPPPERDSQVF